MLKCHGARFILIFAPSILNFNAIFIDDSILNILIAIRFFKSKFKLSVSTIV